MALKEYFGINNFKWLLNKLKPIFDSIDNRIDELKNKTVLTGGSQTSTSTEDGGSNIYTFTKSDGTTSSLTVKNGTKGSKGDKGDTGSKGDKGDTGPQGPKGDNATTTSVVSASANGLAPKVTDTSKFLKGDGTWATPTNTNTTYTFATGDSDYQFKVTPSGGTAQNVTIKGLANASTKTIRTLTAKGHSGWKDATTDRGYVPDMAFIAYWNGAYNSSNSSNLTYCAQGTIIGSNNIGSQSVASATNATNSNNSNLTLSNPTTRTDYYLPFISDIVNNTKYPLRGNDGIRYRTLEGTADATGRAALILGNAIASGTAGNKIGDLMLQGNNAGFVKIAAAGLTGSNNVELAFTNPTADRTITFPDATGTVALTSSNITGTAANSNNSILTLTNPTISTGYYLPFISGINNNGKYPLRGNDGIRYYTVEGTASALGFSSIRLGNSIASGVAKNKYGDLYLYGSSNKYVRITGKDIIKYNATLNFENPTADRTITFPNSNGILTTGFKTTYVANKSTYKSFNISDLNILNESGTYLIVEHGANCDATRYVGILCIGSFQSGIYNLISEYFAVTLNNLNDTLITGIPTKIYFKYNFTNTDNVFISVTKLY